METLNRNHISYQEMDELISLAEKVYESVELLKSNVKSKQTQIVLLIMSNLLILILVFYSKSNDFLNLTTNITIYGLIVVFLGGILGAITVETVMKSIQIINDKSTILREQNVLKKLLNMIEGYKNLYFENEYGNEYSVLSKALFEMRLSRINFGGK